MADRIIYRPLSAWPHRPTPSSSRQRWQAQPKYLQALTVYKALDLVKRELRLLGVRGTAYIEVDVVGERDVRQDGELRSDARFNGPGCIISAEHPKAGSLRWACDSYTRLEYNIRAIAATIESLRAVERYGCVRDAEQFRGFKAIPSSTGVTLSREAAVKILRAHSGEELRADTHAMTLLHAFQVARNRTHPDRGGDPAHWHAVEAAARVLGLL